MPSTKSIEVFRWDRARAIYAESKSQCLDASMAVYRWLMQSCGADHDDAARIATSPLLKTPSV